MLGVGIKELKDAAVDLPIYLRSVKIFTDRLDARLWPYYLALPSDPTTYTSDQQNFSELFLAYIGWTTARQMSISLTQFSPREIGDGKATMQRQANSAMDVLANIDAQLGAVSQQLTDLIELLDPTAPALVTTAYVVGIFDATGDPVTG